LGDIVGNLKIAFFFFSILQRWPHTQTIT
jgi:hypothetical protein